MEDDPAEPLELGRDGAERLAGAALGVLADLESALRGIPPDRAGVRLRGLPALTALLRSDGPVGRIAACRVGGECRPVRALLFDKKERTNWALGWHQDRTIAVARRVDAEGFGPWTVKQGLSHVEPPFELIEQMVTLRIHLDDVPADNAPLLIAPGSHLLGRIAEDRIEPVVEQCGVRSCTASRGDVWIYATSILHASKAAEHPVRRRVLQVDYSASELPAGLEWLGV